MTHRQARRSNVGIWHARVRQALGARPPLQAHEHRCRGGRVPHSCPRRSRSRWLLGQQRRKAQPRSEDGYDKAMRRSSRLHCTWSKDIARWITIDTVVHVS